MPPPFRFPSFRFSPALAAALLLAALPSVAQVSVTTSMYNNQRTGVNGNESLLTPATVNTANFGKLFSHTVDGFVYAQPLYVPNVSIGGAPHNVVYVATQHDSVYAFDADSNAGANAQPLWHTSFLSAGVTTVPSDATHLNCTDIYPEYGISSTPVIDLATNTMYVVAKTLANDVTYDMTLHALDITSGAEKPGSPVSITATVTVPGQGPVTFSKRWELQRPGLLLYNGVVYIGFGSACDNINARGWILGYAYNGANFSQTFVFSVEPSSTTGQLGNIWMAGGQGLPMDTGSNLFVATGNGQFDTAPPRVNYGNSMLRIDLAQGPIVQDFFTPFNQDVLNANDRDLGSGGITILPNQAGPNPHLLVQRGKDGVIRVVNRDNLGQYNSLSNNIVQEIPGGKGHFASPVYFNGKIYFQANSETLRAFSVTSGVLSTTPVDASAGTIFFPGATPVISANGTSNAILWIVDSDAFSKPAIPGGPAILIAYDANNLAGGLLYTSSQNLVRDDPGGAVKFSVPTVANGKVFMGTEGKLSVFGVLGGGVPPPVFSAAVSRRVHGFAGTFDLPLSAVATNPTVEPRQGPAQKIVVTFNKPLTAATAAVTEGVATASTPTISGNDVIVDLTGATDRQYVTIALTNVASTDGGVGGSATVRVGLLAGDVNQTRAVTVSDLALVNLELAQTVTLTNYLKDVNASGTITLADKGVANANLAQSLPPP